MPSATYRHQAVVAASLERVWEGLQWPDTWALVAGADSTDDHQFDGSQLVGFRFTARVGGVTYRGRAAVTDSIPGREMTLSVRSPELGAIIRASLAAEGEATRLAVTMVLSPAGVMGSLAFGVVSSAVARGFGDSVERLARRLSGES